MLNFLYYAVSWVLLRWHDLMNLLGLDPAGGLNWGLSIVLLVVTARLLLFRLFVKQVHHQRRMQELQPKFTAIREKYKNDKAAQQREMMALQQAEGFNMLAGCLPLVAQLPVFIGLLHVLRHLATASNPGYPDRLKTLYGFTALQTNQAAHAKIFGAPLSAQFQNTGGIIGRLGGDLSTTRVVITVVLVVSALATFLTQRQVMARGATTAEGTAALVQKAMLYLVPVGVLASGFIFNFPLGVLLYWLTSNVWTMAQQFYINKYHPHTPVVALAAPEVPRSPAPRPGAKPVGRGKRSATARPAGPPALGRQATSGAANNGRPTDAPAAADPASSRTVNRSGGHSPGADGVNQVPGRRPRPGQRSGQVKKRR